MALDAPDPPPADPPTQDPPEPADPPTQTADLAPAQLPTNEYEMSELRESERPSPQLPSADG